MSYSSNISLISSKDANSQSSCDLFQLAEYHGLDEIHFRSDPSTGLKAIIAIHNSNLGPALGGTRSWDYHSTEHAIADVVRLARGMSYKSAFAGLPYGGGKAVLIRPHTIENPSAYFEAYGKFIDSLGGRFITAVDVGTSVGDMDIIANQSAHVLSTSATHGDPSFFTALGVYKGICAIARLKFDRADLNGLRVAIQGAGKVGVHLASLLHKHGATLCVNDLNPNAVQQCVAKFDATPLSKTDILNRESDIFAPCAMGGILDESTANNVNTAVVCGAANNQLAEENVGDILHNRGIFYAPDYVVNVGGLTHVILGDTDELRRRIERIYDAILDIYQRSIETDEPAHRVADRIAEDILYA